MSGAGGHHNKACYKKLNSVAPYALHNQKGHTVNYNSRDVFQKKFKELQVRKKTYK